MNDLCIIVTFIDFDSQQHIVKISFKCREYRLGDNDTRGDEPDEMGDMLPEVDLGSMMNLREGS